MVGPVAHHIEPRLRRQIQHLANPRKIQFVGLVAQGEKFLPLCMGQGMTVAAFLYANMVEFCSSVKYSKDQVALAARGSAVPSNVQVPTIFSIILPP